jgi:hypothetical protein
LSDIAKQVRSGLELAVLVLASLALALTLAFGIQRIMLRDSRDLLIGAIVVLLPSAVLFLTARHWAKWFFGATCFYAVRTVITGLYAAPSRSPAFALPTHWFGKWLEF